jgi:hypothetical protein
LGTIRDDGAMNAHGLWSTDVNLKFERSYKELNRIWKDSEVVSAEGRFCCAGQADTSPERRKLARIPGSNPIQA